MKLFWALIIPLIAMNLSAVNRMDLMMTLSGEAWGSEFGASMVSMDFNGDGCQDLIVKAPAWNPNGTGYDYDNMYGRIYFYWGGAAMDTIPDFVITGQYPYHLGSYTYSQKENLMINGGDMNGDGFEDLVVPERNADGTRTVSVYFGRAIPQANPDVELLFPYPETQSILVFPLGDLNGDGLCDISITLWGGLIVNYMTRAYIWTDVYTQPELFRTILFTLDLIGVGDVNNDGFDDVVLTHQENEDSGKKFTFFYGDTDCTFADSLFLGPDVTQVTTFYSSPLGDVNNDGFGDFTTWTSRTWLGSENLRVEPNLTLEVNDQVNHQWASIEENARPNVVYGDLNNDGYDDIIGSCTWINGHSGEAGVWMGRQTMNGTRDLIIHYPASYPDRNFGWCKAAGDFNGDGFCDVAISAPLWLDGDHSATKGKVFIYSGNAQLTDTTVANEDELATEMTDANWSIDVYPNPARKQGSTYTVGLSGAAYQSVKQALEMDVYNIKGQKVSSHPIKVDDIKSGKLEFSLSGCPAGIYIICIKQNQQALVTKRISLF